MDYPEFAVSIGTLDDNPLITLKGIMNAWHVKTVEDVVSHYVSGEILSITIDASQVVLNNAETLSLLIRMLRAMTDNFKVNIIAPSDISPLLELANLGPNMQICTCSDDDKTKAA